MHKRNKLTFVSNNPDSPMYWTEILTKSYFNTKNCNNFLLCFRVTTALFGLSVIIPCLSIPQDTTNGAGWTELKFFTVWNWIILTIYFFIVSFINLYTIYFTKYKSVNSNSNNVNSTSDDTANWNYDTKYIYNLSIICLICYYIECACVLLVDIVVWGLGYPTMTPSEREINLYNYFSLSMHIVNIFVVYIDTLLNNVLLNNNIHCSIFATFACLFYVMFQWIYISYFNKNDWVYEILDTSMSYWNILWYFGIAALMPIFFKITSLVSVIKIKIGQKHYKIGELKMGNVSSREDDVEMAR